MPGSVSTVIFAIKAGIRLYQAGEQVLVQNTADRALPLPLPIGEVSDEAGAQMWLKTNSDAKKLSERDDFSRLKALRSTDTGNWSKDDKEYVTTVYSGWQNDKSREAGYVTGKSVTTVEAAAYIEISQWSKTEDTGHTTALQRIAGTLVNIAVDYFIQTPGALNLDRPEGRALKGFLEAIDNTDFAGGAVESIAGDVLLAVLDAVKWEPDLIGKGETTQKFVKGIAASLGESTNKFLDNIHLLPDDERERRTAWLQMLAHAMVSGAANVVLTDPEKILGAGKEEAPVIKEVGGTMADLLLGGDDAQRLQFEALFSGEGLNEVVKASLKAVSENPAILGVNNRGLRQLIVDVSGELAQYDDLFARDMGPELIRLILEKTGADLPLLVGGSADNPKKNLLVLAASDLLANISEKSWSGGWHPTLTRDQVLDVAEDVFDEVLDNPYWLRKIQSVGGPDDTPLSVAIEAVVTSLKNTGKGDRLSSETVIAAIKAGVDAAAMDLALLKKVPDAAAGDARTALTAALDAVFDGIFADSSTAATRWRQAGNAALQATVELVLDEFAGVAAQQGVKSAQITRIQTDVRQWVDAILAGADPEQLIHDALLDAA
jgi:hypothetical protein